MPRAAKNELPPLLCGGGAGWGRSAAGCPMRFAYRVRNCEARVDAAAASQDRCFFTNAA